MASPDPKPALPPLLWSHSVGEPPHGLCLAREKEWLFAWSERGRIYLVDQRGERQAQRDVSGPLTAGAAAEDGSAFAVADSRGRVAWLTADLSTRWEQTLAEKIVALALDPHGQYLAAAAVGGRLQIFDRHGRSVSQTECPRPLHFLAFVPEAPILVGSADYGLLACFDLTAKCLWRDGLVCHVGSLAVSGDGDTIVLACFSEGVRNYSRQGKTRGRIPLAEGCSSATIAYDGDRLVVATPSNRLIRLTGEGKELRSAHLEKRILGLALNATGERTILAFQGGGLMALEFREDPT